MNAQIDRWSDENGWMLICKKNSKGEGGELMRQKKIRIQCISDQREQGKFLYTSTCSLVRLR